MWPNGRTAPRIVLEKRRKNTKDCRCSGRDANRALPECMSGVLSLCQHIRPYIRFARMYDLSQKELETSCSVEEIWHVESWRNYKGTRERQVFPVSGGARYGAHFIKVY